MSDERNNYDKNMDKKIIDVSMPEQAAISNTAFKTPVNDLEAVEREKHSTEHSTKLEMHKDLDMSSSDLFSPTGSTKSATINPVPEDFKFSHNPNLVQINPHGQSDYRPERLEKIPGGTFGSRANVQSSAGNDMQDTLVRPISHVQGPGHPDASYTSARSGAGRVLEIQSDNRPATSDASNIGTMQSPVNDYAENTIRDSVSGSSSSQANSSSYKSDPEYDRKHRDKRADSENRTGRYQSERHGTGFSSEDSDLKTAHDAHSNVADAINQRLNRRDMRNRILNSAGNVLSKPAEAVSAMVENSDDEGIQGVKKVEDYVSVVPSVLGGLVDNSDIEKITNSIKKRNNDVLAGDAFERLIGTGAVNASALTNGDYAAFRAKRKHPDLSDEDMLKIKHATESKNGRTLLTPKKSTSNKAQAIARSIRMNQAESFAEELMMKHIKLFTLEEQAILKSENSIFKVENLNDFKVRDQLINKMLSDSRLIGGELSKIDWSKMTARDISDILKGRTGLLGKLKKSGGIQLSDNIRGLLELKLDNFTQMQKIRERERRKKNRKGLKGELFDRALMRPLMMDEEFSAAAGVMEKGTKALTLTGKTALKTGELSYMAARKTGQLAGKGAIAAAKAAGNNEVAKMVAELGKKYTGIEDAVSGSVKKVKEAPGKAMKTAAKLPAKGIAKAGMKISQTKLYKKFSNSFAGRITKGIVNKIKVGKQIGKNILSAAFAPARGISNAMSFLKTKIMIPVVIGLGGLFLVELIVGFFASGNSNTASSALGCIILDDEQHFQDFQAKYDEQDSVFQAQVNSIINSDAQTRNLKGARIGYGINTHAVDSLNPDLKLQAQYQNGLHLGYYYDGQPATGISSNIEDILSAMAVIMTQSQSDHHNEAMEFVEAAYKSTHSYTTSETPLYQCPTGCEITYYKCYDWINNYDGTDMMYHPWTYQEIVKPTSSQECVVCKQEGLPYEEYAGCTVTKKCYHGDREEGETLSTKADDYANYFEFDEDDSDDASEYYTEYITPSIVNKYSTKYPDGYNKNGVRRWVTKADIIAASGLDPQCDNYKIITVNSWEEYTNSKGHERVHSEPCGYVAVCEGHDHYGCPDGHYVKTCFGHTDLNMNVYVASLNKIFEMGGVPITEKAGAALNDQVYGMNKEEFEKLSPEEQEKVIEKYNKKLEQTAGGGS